MALEGQALNLSRQECHLLVQRAVEAVRRVGVGKRLVLVDGVGYPAVGSVCGISNADVALALGAPVLLVGKSGVGDAIDSFNLNAAFFEARGVRVLPEASISLAVLSRFHVVVATGAALATGSQASMNRCLSVRAARFQHQQQLPLGRLRLRITPR
jgi:hypothetical protein